MIENIPAALSAIKTSIDLTTTMLKKIKNQEEKEIVLEIKDSLLEAKENIQNLKEENSFLKEKLKEKEFWEEEKINYKKVQVSTGNFAYIKNEDVGKRLIDVEKLCVNCFENKKTKSSLIHEKENGRRFSLRCPNEKSKFIFNNYIDFNKPIE